MIKLETLSAIIKDVGFPICMCFLLFSYIQNQTDKQNEILTSLIISINNNTSAINALKNKVDK